MNFYELTSFFNKLQIKDNNDSRCYPNDDQLISKIKKGTQPKYLNLETGRVIISSSANKKKYIDHKWFICGDDMQQFNRITKKLSTMKQKEIRKDLPKRRPIPKTIRHQLWLRDYGNVSEAKCLCCKINIITESTSEAGHIIAFTKGGSDQASNIRLICRTCNADMGTQDMNEFIKKHHSFMKL